MGRKKTARDYHDLAEQRGFEWLGESVPGKGTHEKTTWKCENGHTWEITYKKMYHRKGCPRCSEVSKKTEQDYHELASARGFKWIGETLPQNWVTKTTWKCAYGHTWEAKHYSIIRLGAGCPYCAGKRKKIEQDYHELAERRGFKWLGRTLPGKVAIKTDWKCQRGHVWKTTYNILQNGHGCPYCVNIVNGARASKLQIEMAEMLEGEVNYKIGKRYADIALSDEMIVVEYDCYYWHGHKIKEDRERAQELINLGWRVLTIKARNKIPTLEQLRAGIERAKKESYFEIILEDWGKGDIRG